MLRIAYLAFLESHPATEEETICNAHCLTERQFGSGWFGTRKKVFDYVQGRMMKLTLEMQPNGHCIINYGFDIDPAYQSWAIKYTTTQSLIASAILSFKTHAPWTLTGTST